MKITHFSENMKKYRAEREMSLTDLSDALRKRGIGISAPTLQRYESGKIKNVPYDTITAIAECFFVEPQILMGWSDARPLNVEQNNLLDKWGLLSDIDKEDVLAFIDFKLSRIKK